MVWKSEQAMLITSVSGRLNCNTARITIMKAGEMVATRLGIRILSRAEASEAPK